LREEGLSEHLKTIKPQRPLSTSDYRPKLDVDAGRKVARNFDVEGYKILSKPEQLRATRIVRVGLVQNQIVLPTSDPIEAQRNALHARFGEIAQAAFASGVNVLGLQEAWRR